MLIGLPDFVIAYEIQSNSCLQSEVVKADVKAYKRRVNCSLFWNSISFEFDSVCCVLPVQGAHSSMSSDEKNVMIWNQTTVMSDMSLSTDF